MTTLYQLPCANCQSSLPVSATQAGEELPCQCGATVLVPTLRELKSLPVAAVKEDESRKGSAWTPLQGALFAVGILLLASGIYMHFQSTQARNAIDTSRPEFEELEFDIQDLSPYQAWRTWENIEKLRDRMSYRPTPDFLARREEFARWTRYRYASWGIALVGGVLVTAAFGLRLFHRN